MRSFLSKLVEWSMALFIITFLLLITGVLLSIPVLKVLALIKYLWS